MGTHCATQIQFNFTPLVTLVQQSDGYPSSHGKMLADFLKGIELVQGTGTGDTGTHANGSGCLAAQLVMQLKVEAGLGGIYLVDHETLGQMEYNYAINIVRDSSGAEHIGGITVTDEEGDATFIGDLIDFEKFCKKYKD